MPAAGGKYKTMAAKSSKISGVRIEKLIYGGDGLAHHDGSTVFVPFVLPEERVDAEVAEQKKKFVRANLDSVIEPSPARVAARCPHFAVCGGCHYQHIPCDAQLQYKTEILRETLRRIGHMDWTAGIRVHSAQPWGYRNRSQWKVRPLGDFKSDDSAAAGQNGAKLGIGYFEPHSTALCAVHDCPILSPPLLKTLLALRDALAAGALPRALHEIEAFASTETPTSKPKLLLTATFAGFSSRSTELAETIRAAVPDTESLLLHDPSHERMELSGPGFIEYEIQDSKYRVGHFSFFQVNDFLVAGLLNAVAGSVEGGQLAFDLFAGVGLFSVPLAQRFSHVLAVEANPAAARDLETNTRGHGSIEVRTAGVEHFLDQYLGRRKNEDRPDLVVLDPPRAGLTPGAVDRLIRLAPSRITYVSCEPPTLARDLKLLREGGYEISDVQLFDLFPQTFHIETLAQLRKRR